MPTADKKTTVGGEADDLQENQWQDGKTDGLQENQQPAKAKKCGASNGAEK